MAMNRYDIALGRKPPLPTLKYAEPAKPTPAYGSQAWHEEFAKRSAELLMHKLNRER